MRDKLADFGGRFFENYELLEMLLYSAVPYKDTKPISKRLLIEFGSLKGVFSAEPQELMTVDGIGTRCAEFLLLAGRVMKAGELVYFNKPVDQYNSYRDTGELFVRFFKENKDTRVALMLLDGNMRILSVEPISEGSFGSVGPAGFVKAAVSFATEIAIVGYTHNHGPLFPTEADRESGKMVVDELGALGITVAEQYIVCGEEFVGVGTGMTVKLSSSPSLDLFIKSKEKFISGDTEKDAQPIYPSSSEYMVEYLTRVLEFQLKKASAAEAAKALSVKYGNIDRILSAEYSELERVGGMNKSAALLIKLLGYCASRAMIDGFDKSIAHTDDEIYEYFKAHFIGLERETVYLMSLDGRGRVISCDFAGEGTVNGSDVYPRRLLELAVRSGATSVIIGHNHPSSTPKPSHEDAVSTEGLASFFSSAGIRLLKHIVVSGREHSVIEPTFGNKFKQ